MQFLETQAVFVSGVKPQLLRFLALDQPKILGSKKKGRGLSTLTPHFQSELIRVYLSRLAVDPR